MSTTKLNIQVGRLFPPQAALPLLELRKLGFKGPFFGTPSLLNRDFVRISGAAAEGMQAYAGDLLGGAAANSIGSLGGVVAPNLLPYAHETTGSFDSAC